MEHVRRDRVVARPSLTGGGIGMVRSNTAPATALFPGLITIELTVNGTKERLDIAPWTTLLDALRDRLGLIGTKKGCDHANAVRVRFWSTADGSIPA